MVKRDERREPARRDIRVQIAFFDHPKTVKLRRRVGGDGALAFMRLWAFCAVPERCSGDLSGLTDEDIEIAARWDGEPDKLVAALVEVGFIDGAVGHRFIHDFEDHQPWVAKMKVRSDVGRANAKKRWEEKNASDMQTASAKSNAKSPENGASCIETGANGNAPIPTPIPCPTPIPDPSPGVDARGISKIRIGPDSRPPVTVGDVHRVFEHWNARPGVVQILQPHTGMKEWAEIQRRLGEDGCTAQDLFDAIDGLGMDQWSERKSNMALIHAVKSLAAVQRFAALARDPPEDPRRIVGQEYDDDGLPLRMSQEERDALGYLEPAATGKDGPGYGEDYENGSEGDSASDTW